MRSKVKITKKQIKQDKFTNFMLQARDWCIENWQPLVIGVAVVIVAIVAIVYFLNVSEAKSKEGAMRLSMAVANLNRGNYQEAILELSDLSENYGGRTGGMALFYLANGHYESRNFDQAIENYQKFIDEYHIDDLTTASAIAGIAACLENKQEFLAAGDKFCEAIEYYPGSPLLPDFYLGAVRNYVNAGDLDKTEKTLAVLNEKFPNTESARVATRLSMSLKIK